MKHSQRIIPALGISLVLSSSLVSLPLPGYGAPAPEGKEAAIPGVKEIPKPSVIKEEQGKVYLSKDDDDVIFKALTDEMKRSCDRLKLGSHNLPYFLQYKVLETDMFYLSASCGAVTSETRNRYRRLYTDVRVGDYELDSSKEPSGMSSIFGRFTGGGKELPVEDNYDAIRHEVWMATDTGYKDAIEQYENKKARLKARPEEDRLPEMTKEKPVVFIKPRLSLKIDEDKWRKVARDLSGIFIKYPEIDNSVVYLSSQVGNAWLMNNEGFKHRDGHVQTLLSIMAKIRSKDGHSYSDVEFVAADNPDELPDYATLEQKAKNLIKRLKKIAEAPTAQTYSGPVLFEPDASSSLLYSALSRMMGGTHDSGNNYFAEQNPLKNKLNQRIGSRIINVFDDPLAEEYKGKKLYGAFEVDDDGMPAERIQLVDKGILKTFCTSRRPTRGVMKSNGHSGDGAGTVSILFVSTEPSMNAKQLKKKLIELGKDEGYDYVYIVRNMARMPSWLMSMGSMLSSVFSSFGGGLTLYPTEVYRVSVKSGKEELVRGATVSVQPDRVLRDLVAGGSDETATLVAHGPTSATSIVVPSIILRDVDLKEPPKESEKAPVLSNPLKDEQEGKQKAVEVQNESKN